MARKSSQPSSEIEELTISLGSLQSRWRPLVRQLRLQLGLAESELSVALSPTPSAIYAEFAGGACEYVDRNRGGRVSVAPFTKIGHGSLQSWLGLQEKWEQRTKGRYVFHHVSLTVHLGYAGELLKPQIFRSEWPGITNWDSSRFGFQAPGAGHPHWQFDAMTAVREKVVAQREQSLAVLREESVVTEFELAERKTDILLDVRQAALERIHFASAAPWWRQAEDGSYGVHMNAPGSAEEVARWMIQCIVYIKQELKRLQ